MLFIDDLPQFLNDVTVAQDGSSVVLVFTVDHSGTPALVPVPVSVPVPPPPIAGLIAGAGAGAGAAADNISHIGQMPGSPAVPDPAAAAQPSPLPPPTHQPHLNRTAAEPTPIAVRIRTITERAVVLAVERTVQDDGSCLFHCLLCNHRLLAAGRRVESAHEMRQIVAQWLDDNWEAEVCSGLTVQQMVQGESPKKRASAKRSDPYISKHEYLTRWVVGARNH